MAEVAIVVPLAPMPVGAAYRPGQIPLHVTVLPNLAIDGDAERLVDSMAAIAASMSETYVVALHDELFGPSRDIAVTEVEVTPELRRLHDRLRVAAQTLGGTPVVPDFHGDGFRAHATVTFDGGRINPGDEVQLKSLVLLDCTAPMRHVTGAASFAG